MGDNYTMITSQTTMKNTIEIGLIVLGLITAALILIVL